MKKVDLIRFLRESNEERYYLEELCSIANWSTDKMEKFKKKFYTLGKINDKWQASIEWWNETRKLSWMETHEFNMRIVHGEELPEGVRQRIFLYNKQHLDEYRSLDLELLKELGIKYKWKDDFREDELNQYHGEWVAKFKGNYYEEVPIYSKDLNELLMLLNKKKVDYKIESKEGLFFVNIGNIDNKGSELAKLIISTYIEYLRFNENALNQL